jgi:predicted dienelactone hydrolase
VRRIALLTLVATLLAADGAAASGLRVGHGVERLDVQRTPGAEIRHVDVHLWYPAEHSRRPKAKYTSLLHGRAVGPWTPLMWEVEAEFAREDAPIERRGKRFPAIVFSHGSVNEPIDYAHTLERIAAAGFVVAAPSHVNNSQDDVRIDFINAQTGVEPFACRDGLPGPCSRTNVPLSMADRVTDISAVIDALPKWFGRRVDASQVGVLGHSRGTVSALAAAGGSVAWPLEPDKRVDAVMGMAIAVQAITEGVDLANVKVPTVLVAGGQDRTSPPEVSEFAFNAIASRRKAFLLLEDATHRTFDSTYCDQLQAAGAFAQDDPKALLDLHTFNVIANAPPAGASGRATEYCDYEAFTDPVDIRPLVASHTGVQVTRDNVPSTGLDTDEVKRVMAWLAAKFFGKALKR